MEWFFAFNEGASDWFSDMIKVAVISASRFTSLEPHCLYDGQPNALTDWLQATGVEVHFHEVPFKDELSSPEIIERNKSGFYTPQHASGAFLRVEAALFAKGRKFLYTDCDIMFMRDVPAIDVNLGAVAEGLGGGFNSGVMIADREWFLCKHDELVEHFRINGFYSLKHSSYDQVLLNWFFGDLWTRLPDTLNWRPWMGINPKASIIHFHGPKPTRVHVLLESCGAAEEAGLLAYIKRDESAYKHYIGIFAENLAWYDVQASAEAC